MQNPVYPVTAFATEVVLAVARPIELDAQPLQIPDSLNPLVDQYADRGGIAESAAGGDGVGKVQIGRIACANRSRHSALGHE